MTNKDFRLSKSAKRMLALMHPVDNEKRALWKASHIEAEVAQARAKLAKLTRLSRDRKSTRLNSSHT